jgi:3',5'-cyclic AMP phosphodiesterase CpdA
MIVAQLSDLHVGAARYEPLLLRQAIAEINDLGPDLVVVAGDVTDEGLGDQYESAADELDQLTCGHIVVVPGNHDARNVGDVRFEQTFGARDSLLRERIARLDVTVVAVDSSKPDLDEGLVGREHYPWVQSAFADVADLRIFVCHHHLVAIPGTGREHNQLLDAGDVLALLHHSHVDLVLAGHRHVPYVWPIAGMYVVNSGTVSTSRTRGFPHPAYNIVRIDRKTIEVEARVPGGVSHLLGVYPRPWPDGLGAPQEGLFVPLPLRSAVGARLS